MAFTNSRDFVINGGVTMVDNSGEMKENTFQLLYNAACHGATHKSGERFDPPKCHPETRTAVIDDIMSWAKSSDPVKRILWMRAPAGAGKSAIAQTVAEICDSGEDMLIATFFFSRTASLDSGRSDGNRLIPSLAYQMTVSIAETKSIVSEALKKDPAILTYSMEKQMEKLIVEPLLQLRAAENLAGRRVPELVIIDGLDECHDPRIQVKIIDVISQAITKTCVSLRFLVTSRPELEIRKAFAMREVNNICFTLVLDEKYNPDKDIELFIRSQFNTIKREHCALDKFDNSWPDANDVDTLVQKSSGQFIYASTVMKFINNDRKNPKALLNVIINIARSPNTELKQNPYAELDALYFYILSKCEDEYSRVKNVFEVLLFTKRISTAGYISMDPPRKSLSVLGDFICIEDVNLLVADLHSILDVDNMIFYHASFSDFLFDVKRSGIFFIDRENREVAIVQLCLTRIRRGMHGGVKAISDSLIYACLRYLEMLFRANLRSDLANHLLNNNPLETIVTISRHLLGTPWLMDPMIYELVQLGKKRLTSPLEILDIGQVTYEVIDKRIKDLCGNLSSTRSREQTVELYLRSIYNLHRGYHVALGDYSVPWIARILDCPIHGGEQYYLDAVNSEKVFRLIWEEMRDRMDEFKKCESGKLAQTIPPVSIYFPATLLHLLDRYNIPTTFRSYLRQCFPEIRNYFAYTDANVINIPFTDDREEYQRDVSQLLQYDIETLQEPKISQRNLSCTCSSWEDAEYILAFEEKRVERDTTDNQSILPMEKNGVGREKTDNQLILPLEEKVVGRDKTDNQSILPLEEKRVKRDKRRFSLASSNCCIIA